jgi:hypothetical protein
LLYGSGYQLYRRDRTGKKGGGVVIFVRNGISSYVVSFSHVQSDNLVEVLWIRCNFLNAIYNIAGCYHIPKARYADSVLTDLMSNQLNELFHIPITSAGASATFVIAGDFNTFNTGFFKNMIMVLFKLSTNLPTVTTLSTNFLQVGLTFHVRLSSLVALKLNIKLCM